jgi:hypothetical protein
VVALEVHLDLAGTEVIVLPEIDDLGDHFAGSLVRARVWANRPIPEADHSLLLVAAIPPVVGGTADAVVAARLSDAAGHLLGVADDR